MYYVYFQTAAFNFIMLVMIVFKINLNFWSMLFNCCIFCFLGGQYQVVAPSYYENGSVMMGNARGMGTAMRLVPPVLVNPAAAPNSNPGK